jgi:NTE family protein
VVVGTSAGSLVAVLYASGKNAAELESLSASIEEGALADWTLPFVNRGVLKGEALAKYVNQQLGGRLLEQLPIAVGVVATDLATGQGVLFRKGRAGTAVRASSSVPGVFQPVNIAGHEYVDGGLVAPVPVRYAQQMGADVVIAVDISSTPDGNHTDSSLKVMLQTFAIMGQSINQHELGYAQIVVKPALAGVGGAAFSQRQQSIAAGKEAMLKALPKLTYELARWSSQK